MMLKSLKKFAVKVQTLYTCILKMCMIKYCSII